MSTKFWLENMKGSDHLEGLDVGRRIILKWVLKYDGWGWSGPVS